jgi:hypothetical protein
MDAKTYGLLASTVCWSLLLCGAARADHGGFPIEQSEGVNIIFGLPAQPPDNTFEASYPSEVASNHQKSLRFVGILYNLSTIESANAVLWLHWEDPLLPGSREASAPELFQVLAGGQLEVQLGVMIPFTPERVGIHIQNNGPGEPLAVSGFLIHQTLPVPEPGAFSIAILGMVALLDLVSRMVSPRSAKPIVSEYDALASPQRLATLG